MTYAEPAATQKTAAALLPRSFAYEAEVLPLAYDGVTLTVGVATENPDLSERIRQQTRKALRTIVLPVRDIRDGLTSLYPPSRTREADSAAAQALDDILASAITTYASDVHIEPTGGGAGRTRLDVDGILQSERILEAGLFERIVALLKVRAEMNAGDSRLPQDGRLNVDFDGRAFDVRASTIPIDGMEKVVLRFLQRFDLVPGLEQLGMATELMARFQRALRRPGSFCVIAGPTGSGKSTTSYAALHAVDLERSNVCSVEEPIECRIPGVAQIAVNERAGVTFPVALRALLRQNPHRLFIGELRDAETVAIALQASLTGIALTTTLHARDALRVASRLAELGASRSTLASSLTASLSQRLLRTLCRHCKQRSALSSHALAVARRYGLTLGTEAFEAQGCEICDDTGFQGRIGAFELLENRPEIAASLERGDPPAVLGKVAFGVGYRPMIVDALRHVGSGLTSESEVLRHRSYDDAE
ncbi:MAG: Flp pilus assembly complex ATPase component TadA [Candidatus Eremiobacteraeota bacterium]|nr:Flp pilus assembly complex ATPase component TadA [Candidatus Eremiobacteraeota bacterium]